MKLSQMACIALFALTLSSCVSKPVEHRQPASGGVGDIGSSTDSESSFESFKLPITRQGKKDTRVAANFWSGEWPGPVINVQSAKSGTTTITAYKNLRNPTAADKVSCTIKNGLYHPWSQNDPSLLLYYTLRNTADFKVIKQTSYQVYNEKKKKLETKKIPKGAEFKNVVGYGENLCGSIYQIGKNKKPFQNVCDFFYENKDMVQTTAASEEFYEQWLYLSCEEKDQDGKNLKVFVQDSDLLSQPSITQGCPADYGNVKADCNDL